MTYHCARLHFLPKLLGGRGRKDGAVREGCFPFRGRLALHTLPDAGVPPLLRGGQRAHEPTAVPAFDAFPARVPGAYRGAKRATSRGGLENRPGVVNAKRGGGMDARCSDNVINGVCQAP